MKISQKVLKELSTTMEENGISKQGAITIVSYLT